MTDVDERNAVLIYIAHVIHFQSHIRSFITIHTTHVHIDVHVHMYSDIHCTCVHFHKYGIINVIGLLFESTPSFKFDSAVHLGVSPDI